MAHTLRCVGLYQRLHPRRAVHIAAHHFYRPYRHIPLFEVREINDHTEHSHSPLDHCNICRDEHIGLQHEQPLTHGPCSCCWARC